MKQKLSVEDVLMCVMKGGKEMPLLDGAGNSISGDNIPKCEEASRWNI